MFPYPTVCSVIGKRHIRLDIRFKLAISQQIDSFLLSRASFAELDVAVLEDIDLVVHAATVSKRIRVENFNFSAIR